MAHKFVLTGSCPDRVGINAAITSFLAGRDCSIIEMGQFTDPISGRFFVRIVFNPPDGAERVELADQFLHLKSRFDMTAELHDMARRPRVLMMVSRIGHCMNDILYRYRQNILPIDIPAIVSNHETFRREAEWHGIPFHHLPVSPDNKGEQEAKLWDLIEEQRIDLVILARYMQILSADLSDKLRGRCINIHHSFLPSFKGANPYRQAYERGVKLIGATAHYVTPDLDEGPIIEQDVEHVRHTDNPGQLAAIGRDIECRVFQRAITAHIEHRVLVNGIRTVVLR